MKKKSKLKLVTKNKSYPVQDSPLFKITTKKKLLTILGVSAHELALLRKDTGNYSEFEEIGKNNKPRKIQKPQYDLDKIHTRIASLLTRLDTPNYLHSGKKLHSNISNAKSHTNSSNVMVTDIKAFFPSTNRNIIFSFFYSVMKCAPDVSDALADLCTIHKFLPTGSRISMPLAFWANIRMFSELNNLCIKHNVTFSVYVDDLTFSGANVNNLFKKMVADIIDRHNHIMHPTKTKMYMKNQPKLITGVVVLNDTIGVRNEQHRLLASEFECWKIIKDQQHALTSRTTARLLGRLYSMGSIDSRFRLKAASIRNTTAD